MSIQINKLKCVGCGKCVEACPGNLIKKDIVRRIRSHNNWKDIEGRTLQYGCRKTYV